ncbi:uncharacterized protein ASPGLDRAFT_135660 [Aspergillus glaucus CBS 516.65]|uniref:IgE-binding protein n=1 Tax=Aspergillus glaucus CBS 516.65 TaxID=1160497 RepID=A0A1L9V7Z8_ASPGL|nr:hypothetical protein ASPGLDRAFT_135660 [Aspergillus glaucus CBS 516.65]OJJ80046.1 hypothetical protein ASPGLDRAFT_135660 [Aspergillus glaucus CBS 516.65]
MKFSTFLSILPFLAGVIALPAEKKTSKGFTVVAINPGSPVHNLKLDASSTNLYLNSETDVWCPPEAVKAGGCPGGNTTIRDTPVLASANYMSAKIPGGEHIYVDPNGHVRYTGGSDSHMEPGSSTNGFSQVEREWNYKANGADGFLACPFRGGNDIWEVFVNAKNITTYRGVDACHPFKAQTTPWQSSDGRDFAVWSYT